MASIQNVTLQIVENEGAAAALVSFQVIGNAQDNAENRIYAETVELIGVDEGPNEDGRNEFIQGGRSNGALRFPLLTPNRTRLIAVPAARLDEDPPNHPAGGLATPDEIRARVTLTLAAQPVFAESNTLILHQPVGDPAPA
jgi:hypothetical protein